MRPAFVMFGPAHQAMLALAVLAPLLLGFAAGRAPSCDRPIRLGLAALLLGGWIAWYLLFWSRGWLNLNNGLPYANMANWPASARPTVGVPVTVAIIIHGGKAADPPWLKHGDDVQMNGAGTDPQPNSDEYTFFVTPLHPGKVTFGAIDIRTTKGEALHANAITLAVVPMKK